MRFFRQLPLALLGLSLTSGMARANVTYDFIGTESTGFGVSGFTPSFQLVVTNRAYQRGYLNISRSCGYQNGDAPVSCIFNSYNRKNGFVSLTDATPLYGYGNISLRFLSDGYLSGFINEQGGIENLYLQSSSDGRTWATLPGAYPIPSGSPPQNYYKSVFYSDAYNICGFDSPCTLGGYWRRQKRTHVPEPPTLAILASGLVLLVGAKNRKTMWSV